MLGMNNSLDISLDKSPLGNDADGRGTHSMKTDTLRNTRRSRAIALSLAVLLAAIAFIPTLASALCDKDSFCCSAGTRDGAQCNFDSDCPGGGACIFVFNICIGGTSDGSPFCTSDGDCPGGICSGSQKICVAGDNEGPPLLAGEPMPRRRLQCQRDVLLWRRLRPLSLRGQRRTASCLAGHPARAGSRRRLRASPPSARLATRMERSVRRTRTVPTASAFSRRMYASGDPTS